MEPRNEEIYARLYLLKTHANVCPRKALHQYRRGHAWFELFQACWDLLLQSAVTIYEIHIFIIS